MTCGIRVAAHSIGKSLATLGDLLADTPALQRWWTSALTCSLRPGWRSICTTHIRLVARSYGRTIRQDLRRTTDTWNLSTDGATPTREFQPSRYAPYNRDGYPFHSLQ